MLNAENQDDIFIEKWIESNPEILLYHKYKAVYSKNLTEIQVLNIVLEICSTFNYTVTHTHTHK